VSLRVDYDERAINQAAAFLDDPQGMRAVLDAIDRLADDPRPAGSFPYGSPDLRRLRVGRYRILYEIAEDAIAVRHIARARRADWCGSLDLVRALVTLGLATDQRLGLA
jgi:mRNA interferase RelE/StbE